MISDISNENHLHGNGITSVWIVHFYFPLNVHSYSIIYTRDMHFCFFVFTFHYGSIQIGPNGLRYFWYAEFTFHYGSIQIIRN